MGIMNQNGRGRMPSGGFFCAVKFASVGLALVLGAGIVEPSNAQAPAPDAPSAEASPWAAPEPWRTDRFYIQTSVATRHFNPSPDHVNQQDMVNAEWRFNSFAATGQWLAGAAVFNNSFGQPSQYVYGGWLVRPFEGLQPLYFKITAGALHGYKEPYQNKIPFNSSGVAPAVLPSMGYCFNRVCSEIVLFGGAGVMLTLGLTLP
jgi:hypothetical protein